MKRLWIVLVFLSACGSSPKALPQKPKPALRAPSKSWQFVPQQSAFVMASIAPLATMQWFGNDPAYVQLGTRIAELELQGVNARKQLPASEKLSLRVLEQFGNNFQISAQDLENLGIGASSRGLFYEVDGNFVARVEIAKPEVVRPNLLELFTLLELTAEKQSYQGSAYWEFRLLDGDIRIVVGLRAKELVGALVWTGGTQKVLESMYQVSDTPMNYQELRAQLSKRMKVGDTIGVLDTARSVRLFLKLVDYVAVKEGGEEIVEKGGACDREFAAMVSGVPRVWFSWEEGGRGGGVFFELASHLIPGLEKISHSVPQAKIAGEKPFGSISLGVDLGILMRYARIALLGMSKTDYQCSYLKEFSAKSATMAQSLQALSFSPFAAVKGMALVVESRTEDERGNVEVKALLTVGHASPLSLLQLLRALPGSNLPVSLEKGADPVRGVIGALSSFGPTDFARGEASLGLSIGMSKELRETLDREANTGPLFSMSISPQLNALVTGGAGVEGVFDALLETAILDIRDGVRFDKGWLKLEVFPNKMGIYLNGRMTKK